MQGFWAALPKPFFALAPMANVTDAAFRRIIARYSKPAPYVTWTEFVSADGLVRGNKDVRLRDLLFDQSERPIVAQFFTSEPEMMERAAALAAELGFDGVDINMGCPDRSIEKQGAGAKLILAPERAAALVAAAKRGAPGLPVSVKTRLGYNKDILDEWLPKLLNAGPAAVTVHARTRKDMSKVPARWERVARAVSIRNASGSQSLIIGNGDAADLADARAKAQETGADGVMLGRAIFGRPRLFSPSAGYESDVAKKLGILVKHAKLFEELLGNIPGRSGKSFSIMKKHFKAYVEGFPGARELRVRLMETQNAAEVEKIVAEAFS